MLTETLTRNSGATLIPCVYKTGNNSVPQGHKMQRHPAVFAPVLDTTTKGYFMLMLREPTDDDVQMALKRLRWLWAATAAPELSSARLHHHLHQVKPMAAPPLADVLALWAHRSGRRVGQRAFAVHGDATLENIVEDGLWIDPSTRAMPLEREFDGGKLLQSYFGYGEGRTPKRLQMVREFIMSERLDLNLCAYYLVTHLVRLYRVQPQAREWSVELAANLEERMEEFKCKS